MTLASPGEAHACADTLFPAIVALCDDLQIGVSTAYRRLNDGTVNAVRVGRKVMIRQSERDRLRASLPAYSPNVKAT